MGGERHKGKEQSSWNEELKEMGKLNPSVKERTLLTMDTAGESQHKSFPCLAYENSLCLS